MNNMSLCIGDQRDYCQHLSNENGGVNDEHVDVMKASHNDRALAFTVGSDPVAGVVIVPGRYNRV